MYYAHNFRTITTNWIIRFCICYCQNKVNKMKFTKSIHITTQNKNMEVQTSRILLPIFLMEKSTISNNQNLNFNQEKIKFISSSNIVKWQNIQQ